MAGFVKKSAEKITFDKVGMTVEGQIVLIEKTSYGVNNYTLLQDNGKMVKFLGTTQIDGILSGEKDSIVRLTYKGDAKVRNGTMKNIEVEVYEEDAPAEEAA